MVGVKGVKCKEEEEIHTLTHVITSPGSSVEKAVSYHCDHHGRVNKGSWGVESELRGVGM
jgi:hypothetical protein